MENLMNKTLEEIQTEYKELQQKEDELREMIRMRLSHILMNTSEDNKLKSDIALEKECYVGMSSLEMPWIIAMWQDPSEGSIVFEFDDRNKINFDYLSTESLMIIIKNFE